MTTNEIAYWDLQRKIAADAETARSNLAKERELHRSNVASESELYRSNYAREQETHRHNSATEKSTVGLGVGGLLNTGALGGALGAALTAARAKIKTKGISNALTSTLPQKIGETASLSGMSIPIVGALAYNISQYPGIVGKAIQDIKRGISLNAYAGKTSESHNTQNNSNSKEDNNNGKKKS